MALQEMEYRPIHKGGETFRVVVKRNVWVLYVCKTGWFGRAKWQRIEEFESYDSAFSYIDVFLYISTKRKLGKYDP
jgi:hypothetical protein